MRRRSAAYVTAAALMVAAPLTAQETHRIPGGDVAIYNLAGRARVVAGTGSDVVVRVLRGGEDAARLQVEVGEVDGRQALRVVYPSDRIVYPGMGRGSRTQQSVDADGTFGDGRDGWRRDRVTIAGSGSGMEAWADLEVQVPPGRDFAMYVAAGAVDVEGVRGDVLVDTGSGSVSARGVRGSLLVDTGSGSITVSDVEGPVEVDTGSGSVQVDDVSGESVLVDTGSGGIDLDVPVEVRSVKRNYLLGRIGDGRGTIRIDTGSGSVRLIGG